MLVEKEEDIVEGESVGDWDGITCTTQYFLARSRQDRRPLLPIYIRQSD